MNRTKPFSSVHVFRALLIAALLAFFPAAVQADIAPPGSPSGANPLPEGETTQVRMLSEVVTIDVSATSKASYGQANVTATFNMQNLGAAEEKMQVRFPLNNTLEGNEGYPFYPTVQNFSVWVDGAPVTASTRQETVEYPGVQPGAGTPSVLTVPVWASFPVTFPAGKTVTVQVTYTVFGHESSAPAYQAYDYILVTGAAWYDTIGRADVVLRYPVEVNPKIYYSYYPNPYQLTGQEVRYHFENLEPTYNLTFHVLAPALWQKILSEQEHLGDKPKDGEAWGRLGKAYKEAILERRGYREDQPGKEMYVLSEQAYRQAVTLLPKDADWHYGYADLLCGKAQWAYGVSADERNLDLAGCLEQVRQTLALNPNHSRAKALLEQLGDLENALNIDLFEPGSAGPDFVFLTAHPLASLPTLTATPPITATSTPGMSAAAVNSAEPSPGVEAASPTASAVVLASATAAPPAAPTTAPPQPTATPAKTARNPLCGGSAALLLVPLAFVLTRRRR